MPLNLYRRHYDKGRCVSSHPPNTHTYQSDEVRRNWKKCTCPIYASGKLGDNPKFRKNTRRFLWAEARTVADQWERQGWDSPPPEPPSPPAPAKPRPTIEEAAEACLKEYRSNQSADGTLDSYKTVLKRFRRFSSDVKGYVYLDQWQRSDTYELRNWFKISASGARSYLATVKSFFEFCVDNGWLEENPARVRVNSRLRVQREANAPNPRYPFTDEEIRRMLEACRSYIQRQGRRSDWGGEDLEDFILISLYTGLRISDVALFHISRLADNGDVHLRAIKNGGWVDTWIPEFLQERIRARAAKYGSYIFGRPVSSKIKIVTSAWRKRLDQFWELTGPWDRHPTHHRFRHTFVRILLQKGVTPARVAELIGDTEETVRKSYSQWVSERQDEMRQVLQEAFHPRRLFAVK